MVGQVTLGPGASVWYNGVLRGDMAPITIGAGSNIQDGCVVHVDTGFPVEVGQYVTVGHGAILHGCTVGDGALIGMGAIVLNGAKIGPGAVVAAGALVPQGMEVPAGMVAMGSPAKVRRPLREGEARHNLEGAAHYIRAAEASLPVWTPENR